MFRRSRRAGGLVRGHTGQHTGRHELEHTSAHKGDSGEIVCPVPGIGVLPDFYSPAPGAQGGDTYGMGPVMYVTGREQLAITGMAPRYTLDGSAPNAGSTQYTVPIWLDAAVSTVRAFSDCGATQSAERRWDRPAA